MNSEAFFIGCGGDLVRRSDCKTVREKFAYSYSRIKNLRQVKATIRGGSVAWPGGYPLFLITEDCAALCFECAKKEFRQIVWDYLNRCNTGWRVVACEVNYEDTSLYCDHCSQQIPSAYGDDTTEETNK